MQASVLFQMCSTSGLPESCASTTSVDKMSTVSAFNLSSLHSIFIGTTLDLFTQYGLSLSGRNDFRWFRQLNSVTRNCITYRAARFFSFRPSFGRMSVMVSVDGSRWGVVSFQSISQSGKCWICTASRAVKLSIFECLSVIHRPEGYIKSFKSTCTTTSPSRSCRTFWWMLTLSYTHIQCPPLTTSKYRASVVSCWRYCHALLYDTHTPAWFSTAIAYSES